MKTNYALYFNQFREGDEKGLAFFYKLWHRRYYSWGLRYIKDDVNADCIVSEAFLRLWLLRKQIASTAEIERLLKKLTADGCRAYYDTSNHQFQQSMLRLDELENYREFIAAEDPDFDGDDMLYHQEPDEAVKTQWEQIEAVIPKLKTEQQLFLRLCINYALDYSRIARHLGGISDYQVAYRLEKILRELRCILTDTKKLGTVKNSQFTFQGDVSEEQSEILRLRYTLGYSFAEIAKELNLTQGHVQQVFAAASLKIKKTRIG